MSTKEKRTLSDYLQYYFSKWPYFLISVGVCALIGGVFAYMKLPVYEVDANVLITDNDTQSDFLRSFSMADMFGAGASADEELAIIYSYSLFRDVAEEVDANVTYSVRKNILKRIKVYDNTPVKLASVDAIADTLNYVLRFKLKVDEEGVASIIIKDKDGTLFEDEGLRFPFEISTKYGAFRISKTDFYEEGEPLRMNISFSGYSLAAELLQDDVECFIPNRKANVITLSMKSPNIPYAKKVVNAIVAGYNEIGILDNRTRNQITADFIDERLDAIASELNATEKQVEQYKNDNNLVDLVADAQYIFTKKGTIDEELVKAETETEILEMTRALMNDPEHKYDLIPTPMGAEAAVEAIAEYNKLVLERIRLLNNAKANNVALRTITSQLDVMRDNINATLDRSLASAEVRLKDLRNQMNESDSRLGELPRQEREFLNIKRQQLVKENLYLFLLKQREETNLRIANAIPKGTIIDNAYALTKPVSMSPFMTVAIFVVLGFLIPPACFYCSNLLRTKVATKEELEELTNIPVLGEVCVDTSKSPLVVNHSTNSITAEQLRQIRSYLEYIQHDNRGKVVNITSMLSGEGKSFIATNLAASFSLLGKKTVLVEMDVRKPSIAEALDIVNKDGVTQFISSPKCTLDDIIIHFDKVPGLDVILAGDVPPNPSEMLASGRVIQLFEELKKKYDHIIVDCCPMTGTSETFVLSSVSDISIMVCRAHHTPLKDISRLNTLSAKYRLKQLGLIINYTRRPRHNEGGLLYEHT